MSVSYQHQKKLGHPQKITLRKRPTPTCNAELKLPFSKSSVLALSVSIRYLPIAGSPFCSPERTARTYVSTRSSMAVTPCIEDSISSRSFTGEPVLLSDLAVLSRKSTAKEREGGSKIDYKLARGKRKTDKGAECVHPPRSAWWNRSSTGIGTKTAFSGLGLTPTGELQNRYDRFSTVL